MNGGDALRCVPSTHRQPGRPNAPATEHAAAGSLPEKGPAHGLHKRWPRAEKATKHQHRPPCMHNLGQPVLPLFPAHSSGRAKQTCPSLAAPPLHRPRGSSKRPHASRRPEVHDTTAEGGGVIGARIPSTAGPTTTWQRTGTIGRVSSGPARVADRRPPRVARRLRPSVAPSPCTLRCPLTHSEDSAAGWRPPVGHSALPRRGGGESAPLTNPVGDRTPEHGPPLGPGSASLFARSAQKTPPKGARGAWARADDEDDAERASPLLFLRRRWRDK